MGGGCANVEGGCVNGGVVDMGGCANVGGT